MNSKLPGMALRMACNLLVILASAGFKSQGFVDVTVQAGLHLPPAQPAAFGFGAAFGDFDGDGDLDLVLGSEASQPVRYFRNEGNLTFTDLTSVAGFLPSGTLHGMVVGDVDNDGDLDVYMCVEFSPNRLYINNGSGTFSEEALARGVDSSESSYCAAFGDYDRDGFLDLYVGNRLTTTSSLAPNILYRNNGDGTFSDVSMAAGVAHLGLSFAAPFLDFDDDGWPDIFCANDKGVQVRPNTLYRNNANGTFSDVSIARGVSYAIDGMGCDFVDVFNDGGMDLYVTDSPPDHLFHVWDATNSTYLELAYQYGVEGGSGKLGWACNFVDFDNDGFADLHVVHNLGPNAFYRNPGLPAAQMVPWSDGAPALGVHHAYRQYTAVFGDVDDDGAIDLLEVFGGTGTPQAVRLQRNMAATGNWLKVKTRGRRSNRDGLGARVKVVTGPLTQTQSVRSGVGYLSSSDLRLHFGLGSSSVVDRVEIRWPSGQEQVFVGVSVNQTLLAEEPDLRMIGVPILGTTPTLELRVGSDAGLTYAMAVSLGNLPGVALPSGRVVPINFDWLALYSLTAGNVLLPQGVGALNAQTGAAASSLWLPVVPGAVGWTLHASAVTLDVSFPEQIRTILPAISFTLQ